METEKIIRVLIANRPRLMRDLILSTISERAGIEVLGEVEDERDIRQHVEQTRPDCLIIALDQPDQRPALCDALLRHFPEMKILAESSGQDNNVLFWASMEFCSRRAEGSEEGVLRVFREFGAAAKLNISETLELANFSSRPIPQSWVPDASREQSAAFCFQTSKRQFCIVIKFTPAPRTAAAYAHQISPATHSESLPRSRSGKSRDATTSSSSRPSCESNPSWK